jgi:hypothetical protein
MLKDNENVTHLSSRSVNKVNATRDLASGDVMCFLGDADPASLSLAG